MYCTFTNFRQGHNIFKWNGEKFSPFGWKDERSWGPRNVARIWRSSLEIIRPIIKRKYSRRHLSDILIYQHTQRDSPKKMHGCDLKLSTTYLDPTIRLGESLQVLFLARRPTRKRPLQMRHSAVNFISLNILRYPIQTSHILMISIQLYSSAGVAKLRQTVERWAIWLGLKLGTKHPLNY